LQFTTSSEPIAQWSPKLAAPYDYLLKHSTMSKVQLPHAIWAAPYDIIIIIIIIRLLDMACQNAGHTQHNKQ